jgi:hypothetical protein
VDFIERWFGVSPDGGDGSTELIYLGVFVAVLVAAMLFKRRLTGTNLPD